jgi:Na+-driven multidrug efflux pump
MYLNIARLWALRTPVVYLLAYGVGLGPASIWWGMFVSNMVTAAAGIFYLRKGTWVTALNPGEV